MTGTADTEAAEFKKIYNLDVMVIPTHMPMVRKDYPDAIYKTRREKFDAVILEISGAVQERTAGSGGDHLHRHLRGTERKAQEKGREAYRAQRQAPCQGSGDRRHGGAARRRDHLHQHGRPGNRHRAGRGRQGSWGAAYHRHGTPREPAHRQSAPRALGPPGGSRFFTVLSLPRGRPAADFRRRAHHDRDGQTGHGGGRADRAQPHQPGHRKCPGQGGSPQFRYAQASH